MQAALYLLLALLFVGCDAQSGSAWLLQSSRNSRAQLEREFEPLASPIQVGSARLGSQLFAEGNGRPANEQQRGDLFDCVEPSRDLFERFVLQFDRNLNNEPESERLDRRNLFVTTLRRTILFNRIIQNEILNGSNYELKPEIRNYHFIATPQQQDGNISTISSPHLLWFSDITDCELGLIKKTIFDLFYLIDKNELALAYKLVIDDNQYLPLLNEDGFEQLANILLVRLFDRFKGDDKMNQLFQWPLYLKKLAAFAYNRRQAVEPNFNSKLALITYAYPSYFKDIKYNLAAINRTGDNWKAHMDHEKFNKFLDRRFTNRQERNKRLAIYRQHWTYINLLNEDKRQWQNVSLQPDWLRYHETGRELSLNAKLRLQETGNNLAQTINPFSDGRFKQTQFSDLTDAEFAAFLTNDYSLLENSKESADFIEKNFPIRHLDEKFRGELAAELDLRRSIQFQQQQQQQQHHPENGDQTAQHQRSNLQLARKVIDELISDVGLPIGSVAFNEISEDEHYRAFNQLLELFGKPYAQTRPSAASSRRFVGQTEPDEIALAEERQRRYEQFKLNYGRFKAWFAKEGWQLDERQALAMLRLADMSWQEIKLTLFKVCCLTDRDQAKLSSSNVTIQYLSSNGFMCEPLIADSSASNQQQQVSELAALEIYYYYSVHFNKHHSNLNQFEQRYSIFRYNIDQIRRHSCTRSLTLHHSLQSKKFETLNTIDVLDPRRSYTDDINLDRYRYFSVPNLNSDKPSDSDQQADYEIGFERVREAPEEGGREFSAPVRPLHSSRAGVSYRREAFFSSLLNRRANDQQQQQTRLPNQLQYYDKLTGQLLNSSLNAQKYRQNSAHKVYDLVMQKYRFCVQTVGNIESNLANKLSQQCQASGPLGDQAANSWTLGGSGIQQSMLQLQQQDQCAFYRLGLEPWAEGLIKQDPLSAQLIQTAKC